MRMFAVQCCLLYPTLSSAEEAENPATGKKRAETWQTGTQTDGRQMCSHIILKKTRCGTAEQCACLGLQTSFCSATPHTHMTAYVFGATQGPLLAYDIGSHHRIPWFHLQHGYALKREKCLQGKTAGTIWNEHKHARVQQYPGILGSVDPRETMSVPPVIAIVAL